LFTDVDIYWNAFPTTYDNGCDLNEACGVYIEAYNEEDLDMDGNGEVRVSGYECLDIADDHGSLGDVNRFENVIHHDPAENECFSVFPNEILQFPLNYVLTAEIIADCPDYPKMVTFNGNCNDVFSVSVPQTNSVIPGSGVTIIYTLYEACKFCTENQDGDSVGNVRAIYKYETHFSNLTHWPEDRNPAFAYFNFQGCGG